MTKASSSFRVTQTIGWTGSCKVQLGTSPSAKCLLFCSRKQAWEWSDQPSLVAGQRMVEPSVWKRWLRNKLWGRLGPGEQTISTERATTVGQSCQREKQSCKEQASHIFDFREAHARLSLGRAGKCVQLSQRTALKIWEGAWWLPPLFSSAEGQWSSGLILHWHVENLAALFHS